MPQMLGVAHKGGGVYRCTQTALAGSGTNDLYGPIDREPHDVAIGSAWEGTSTLSAQLGDDLFLLVNRRSVPPRIYKGFKGAIKVRISADPTPTLPLKGEVMTQGGVTGTLLEDYKAGDLYINVDGEVGGNFAAGGVTFTTGSPVTITSREDNGGEFAIDFESVNTAYATLNNTSPMSGLHHGLKSNKPTLGFCFVSSLNDFWTVIRNPSSGLWEENDSGTNRSAVSYAYYGGSLVYRNTVYWFYKGNTNNTTLYVVAMNIGTSVVSHGSVNAGNFAIPSPPVIWNGNIFIAVPTGTTNTTLYQVNGASFTTVANIPSNTASWDISSTPTLFVGRDDNALYLLQRNSVSQNQLWRLYKNSNDDIVHSCPPAARNTGIADIGEAMVPSLLRSGINDSPRGHAFLDIDSDRTTPAQRFWFFNGVNLQGATEYKYTNFVDLDAGLVATVAGTLGTATDLIFQNSVAATLAIGDWIRFKTGVDTNAVFRVVAVSGTNVQLATLSINPAGTAIAQSTPTAGTASIQKAQQFSTESGIEGGLAGVALPSGSIAGGHLYTIGEIHAHYSAQAEAAGGVQMTFDIFDPENQSAGGDLHARGYYMKEDGTYAQMTLLSVGQNVKNGNVNEGLSVGVGKTWVWDSIGDGIPDGLLTRKSVDIEKV